MIKELIHKLFKIETDYYSISELIYLKDYFQKEINEKKDEIKSAKNEKDAEMLEEIIEILSEDLITIKLALNEYNLKYAISPLIYQREKQMRRKDILTQLSRKKNTKGLKIKGEPLKKVISTIEDLLKKIEKQQEKLNRNKVFIVLKSNIIYNARKQFLTYGYKK